jgi:hypothetical protein|tara:strand:+ start:5841 stop:6878 length:1038 start_codon:yes stop_codon:yes gene_type:complete
MLGLTEVVMKRRELVKLAAGSALLGGLPLGSTVAAKKGPVNIEGLAMPPLNTTFMGVLKGASDYYKFNSSTPMIFGASGHAFLINIHKRLDPSGPYVWRRDLADPLVENIGLRMTDLGFYSPQSSEKDRPGVEGKLRDALDKGFPCFLINLENQLITGYDNTGFFTDQPWERNFPPARLSFGSWQELGDQFHVNFYILEKVTPSDRLTTTLDSLAYAVDLHENPSTHSHQQYGVGPDAYAQWIDAAADYGASHGNWWNGTVWSECRTMASGYFAEIGKEYSRVSRQASQLEKAYAEIATDLQTASSREMDSGEKVKLLGATAEREAAAIKMVADLANSLRTGQGV